MYLQHIYMVQTHGIQHLRNKDIQALGSEQKIIACDCIAKFTLHKK
jgi:hypothetical protein